MLTNLVPKVPNLFTCIFCDYSTSRKSQYDRHILTPKHTNLTTVNKFSSESLNIFNCKKCNKNYKSRVGLWNHNKKCIKKSVIILEKINNEIPEISSELILNIIQQNQEFKDLLLEQNKIIIEISKNNNITNNNSNNNINSNNKTFNLQVFLNETCKDAMNIMDFVDSIKIQLADIESIGELGFVNGISKLIIKNLKALDENMRPVHCSDQKRESLYVKDGNVWEKEDADNKKMRKAIKYIAHKNICALPLWRAKYPDHSNSESKRSDQYNYIMMEAMGGAGDNDEEKAEKIIKKISKTVLINKSSKI
jgi:hypothetical protein